MKRILVVLAALVLVFAVACDGDNPSPSGGGNQGGSDNPGQTVPGDVEIPAATDGELSKNLAGIVFAFMEGDWTNHQASTSSENSVREYYSSSNELVLKTETVSSRDESDNPNGSYSSSTTIQIDGYEYLKKGSTLDVHAVGEEGNLDNITSVKIDDTVYRYPGTISLEYGANALPQAVIGWDPSYNSRARSVRLYLEDPYYHYEYTIGYCNL